MPAKKKSSTSKRRKTNSGKSVKAPRYFNPKSVRASIPRELNVHRFSRSQLGTSLVWSTVFEAGAGWIVGVTVPTLSLLPSFSEFVNLYEEYMITSCRVDFTLRQSEVPPAGALTDFGGAELWVFNSAIDGVAPVSVDEFNQRGNLKKVAFGSEGKVSFFFKPYTLDLIDGGGGSTSVGSGKARWLSTLNAGVPHFGAKWGVRQPTGIPQGQLTVGVQVWLAMRAPK